MADDLRDRITKVFQKNVANRMMRLMPFQTLLETTGRRSGEPRRTPLGGRREGDQFWFVSEFGDKSQYIKNIQADPKVRVRLNGRWHNGTAWCPTTIRTRGCARCPSSTASACGPSAPICSPFEWI
jgi:deazaflavin-dependent oxidoreductase (nitroreductase family)